MKNIKKQTIWFVLMMVLSGAPKVWAGMIDAEVLEAAKREENLRLIIYLEYQPTSQIARDIIPLFEPRIKELRAQIMEQHALVAPPKPKFATVQQEREFLKNQPPIPPDIKARISFTVNKCFYEGNEPTDPLPAGTETVDISTLGYDVMQDWFTSIVTPNIDIGEIPWRAVTGAHPGGAATVMDSTLPYFLNDLRYMSAGYGYWVKMKDGTDGGTIILDGTPLPLDTILSLAESWNLVGFLPTVGYYDTLDPPDDSLLYTNPTDWIQKTAPVTDYVLSSIAEKWRIAQGARPGGAAMFADSELPTHLLYTLHDFAPGNGYWIKTYEACDLSYPSDSPPMEAPAMSSGIQDIPPRALSVKPTNRCMFVYGTVTLDGKPAKQGDTIIIYNTDKTVVGKGLVKENGMYGLVAAYGDDLYTDAIDGMCSGEKFSFEINGLSIISEKQIIWNEKMNREVVKVDFVIKSRPLNPEVGQNFPNPFNPDTWIPYQLSSPAQVVIKIYNVHGQLIRTLDLGRKDGGYYTTKERAGYWNGKNAQGERVASGVYFYTIKAGNFVATKKLAIVK